MRIRSFTSIAIFTLALGLTGCRVQSVLVAPSLTPYSYAAPGQTLEWLPYDPKAAPIYVIFDGVPPCKEPFLQLGPKPARCKVLKDHNGYFAYHFDTKPPAPGHDTILDARSCPYCLIAIDPPSDNGAVSANVVKSNDGGTVYPLNVSCRSGVAVVDNTPVQKGVQDNDGIYWIPIYPSQHLTVTTSNMCSGGTNGVFHALGVCTVTGTPSTTPYPYTVQLDKCNGSGSSSLTINSPPPAQ